MTSLNSRKVYTTYFTIACVATFFILSVSYRLLLPFGDEPDFTVRAPDLLSSEYFFWSPYGLLSLFFDGGAIQAFCKINASPFSLSAQIDLASCKEPLSQALIRWLVVILVTLPLFIFCFIRYRSDGGNTYGKDALLLSIIFPGTIYYLGVFSHEQLSLVLSLLIIVTWRFKLATLMLCTLISAVDLGNSVVVIFFVVSLYFYGFITRVYSVRVSVIIMVIQVFLCFLLGHELLYFTSSIGFLEGKSVAMYELLNSSGLAEKYPVILRPIITFMTFIFFTPAFIKVPLAYVFSAAGLFYLSKKLAFKMKFDRGSTIVIDFLQMMVALSCILSFVFMFPNYSNAKYYIFLLPFLFQFFLHVTDIKKFYLFVLFLNLLILLHLMYYTL
ncbi:hypothetical protein GBO14_18390 [Pseudoalteromonas shioyasakiensis]|uniref:hypothetical protein n=1 Tax=Pseudoalteromonas shioyasakiensis TaxID=1190813 RepID=UPI002096604D|nr:hypothetical protein [Pseudoalteromonas shioyasakiensis]MCO6356693.1 hypothetical protein [Pseudoalteromonas shioyasakiensis]